MSKFEEENDGWNSAGSIQLSIIVSPLFCEVEMPWIEDCACLSKSGSSLELTTVLSSETGSSWKSVRLEREKGSAGKRGEAMDVEKESKRTKK